jgi:hypothetical protein
MNNNYDERHEMSHTSQTSEHEGGFYSEVKTIIGLSGKRGESVCLSTVGWDKCSVYRFGSAEEACTAIREASGEQAHLFGSEKGVWFYWFYLLEPSSLQIYALLGKDRSDQG